MYLDEPFLDEADKDLFDINHDGVVEADEFMIGLQMIAESRRDAFETTGDDSFYTGSDELDEEEDDIFRDEYGLDDFGDDI